MHALTELGLGVAHDVPNLERVWRDGPVGDHLDHAICIRPVREGALPLLLGFQEFDGVPDAAVVLGAGEPAVWLLTQPVCGCDACDDGSDRLLDELDDHVLAVVSGDLVQVTSRRGTIIATGSGWSADGSFTDVQNIEALLAQARTGRSPHRVVHGDPWW